MTGPAAAVGALSLVVLAFTSVRASACVCVGEWPSLRKAMSDADVAVTAEVVAQGKSEHAGFYPEMNVAYVDVQVVKLKHGREKRTVLRVWDSHFGTDCTAELHELSPGTFVA